MASSKKKGAAKPAAQGKSRGPKPFSGNGTTGRSQALDTSYIHTPQQLARIEVKAAVHQRIWPIAEAMPPFDGEYNDKLGETLAGFVAEGATLDDIATLPNVPPSRYILRWIAKEDHPFRKLYYDAKELMIALYEERALTAATTPLITTLRTRRQVVTKDGDVVTLLEEREVDNVPRSALTTSTYQWTLSHLSPKKHGKKPEIDSNSDPLNELLSQFRERNKQIEND